MKITKDDLAKIIKEECERYISEANIENPFAPNETTPEKPQGQEFAEELMSLVKSIIKLGEKHGKHIDEIENMVRKALDQASLGSTTSLPQGEIK
tara:strand:+ start:6649 stop:6933 length:285 start_codon:yes stop_codon:yes gene_type:complete